jgi:hypothetical protein
VLLGEVAHVRTGDKGELLNVSVVPVDPSDWPWLREVVTCARVQDAYADLIDGTVRRDELPRLPAFNFILTGIRGGGVTRTLRIDAHGKQWGAVLMELEIGSRPEGS